MAPDLAAMVAAISIAFALVLFGVLLVVLEVGRRLGASRDLSSSSRGVAAVEGAIFALMGLLIAFTFSAAQGRLDDRRRLLIDEANAIGTAYLRVDLLPTAAQPELRQDFRAYVDERIAYYEKFLDEGAAEVERERAVAREGLLWRHATAAVKASPDPRVPSLLLPSINAMFDVAASRVAARHIHAPAPIFVLLIVLAFASALFAGVGMGRKEIESRLYPLAFAALLTTTVLVIFDIEFPRVGFIRINALDYLLTDVRADMN
jgi:hypothetical protein